MRGHPAPRLVPMASHRNSHQKDQKKSSFQEKESILMSLCSDTRKNKNKGAVRGTKPCAASALIFLVNCIHLSYALFHRIMKGVKRMNEITTLTVRLPREDKEYLMKYAEDNDLSASQIVRQLIRNYLFRCKIIDY